MWTADSADYSAAGKEDAALGGAAMWKALETFLA